MAIPKVNSGDLLTKDKWNQLVDQIDLKINRAGGIVSGPLEVRSNFIVHKHFGVGVNQPVSPLHVKGTISTNWGTNFYHYEPQWGPHSKRPWLYKGWSSHTGDYLYMGSSGNRSNQLQGAIIVAERGIYFGKGHDEGTQLTKEWLQLDTKGNVIVREKLGIQESNPQSSLHVNGVISTNWGIKMYHYEAGWEVNRKRPWLLKAWNRAIGDFLYMGSTGNRSNSDQMALLLASKGFFVGTGSDKGEGLTQTILSLTATGDLILKGKAFKPGGGTWQVASDIRLKNVKGKFKQGLEIIRQINPIKFKYNGKLGIATDKIHIGVSAQEVKEIFPEMVEELSHHPGMAEKHKPHFLAVNESHFVYLMLNAIKEIANRLEILESTK